MAYDILGNYVTDDDSDTPVVNEQQKTQQAIQQSAVGAVAPPPAPPAPVAPQPAQQQGPVAPQQPQAQPQQAQPQAPVAPKAPEPITKDPYNAYTARNESGDNPNIGYHDKSKGSAYGTYGITAAAYKDIQRMDPTFKDRDITTLTPEEQDRANLTYKTVLGQQLAAQGVEPSEANTRLAHFMGARGASDYLKTGAISPQAAAANGGIDKVRAIAEGRLAGGEAPASGAADYARQFVQATQSDPKALSAIRNDESAPIGYRQAAAAQDYEYLAAQKAKMEAQQKFQTMAKTGDWSALGKELKSQSESGSIFKAMFYKQAGLNELAMSEQNKIGAGRTWQNIDLADGSQGVVQVGLDGLPIQGYTATGPMDASQLEQAVGMGAGGGKADYVGGSVVNDQTGVVGRIVSKNGRTMVESGGRLYPATNQWRNNTVGTDLRLAAAKASLGVDASNAQAAAAFVGKFNAENGTNYSMDSAGLRNIQAIAQGGQQQMPTGQGGQMAPPTNTQGGAVAPVGGQAAPVAPGQQQAMPVQPQPQLTPAQMTQNLGVQGKEREAFVAPNGPKSDIIDKGERGQRVSSLRDRQLKIILDTPELAGMMQGKDGAGTAFGDLIRDITANKFGGENSGDEYSRRVAQAGLTTAQKAAADQLRQASLDLAPLTLKDNSGGGSVSDAEQKANRDAGIDPMKQSLYGGLANITQNKFDRDMSYYRKQYMERSGAGTQIQESNAWDAERQKYQDAYNNIYAARAKYIASQGYTPQATVDAFKQFPNPRFNPQTGQMEVEGLSKRAATPLSSFNKK